MSETRTVVLPDGFEISEEKFRDHLVRSNTTHSFGVEVAEDLLNS